MNCRYCPQPVVRAGFCQDHFDAALRQIAETATKEEQAKAAHCAHFAFMRRLGVEMRKRNVHDLPLGSLGWMLAGDAAWRAAIAANPGVFAANTCAPDGTIGSEPREVRPPPGSSPTPESDRSEHG